MIDAAFSTILIEVWGRIRHFQAKTANRQANQFAWVYSGLVAPWQQRTARVFLLIVCVQWCRCLCQWCRSLRVANVVDNESWWIGTDAAPGILQNVSRSRVDIIISMVSCLELAVDSPCEMEYANLGFLCAVDFGAPFLLCRVRAQTKRLFSSMGSITKLRMTPSGFELEFLCPSKYKRCHVDNVEGLLVEGNCNDLNR